MEASKTEFIKLLISLQSAIQQHRLISEESSQKRNELWEKISKSTTYYFEEKIKGLYLKESARSLCRSKSLPKPRFLAVNSKEQLGETYTSLMRVLLMIRDNSSIFTLLGKQIDAKKELNEAFLDFLADDIVLFLFADFTSPEKYVVHCLSQFTGLIEEMFNENEDYSVSLQGSSFINRLLKSFLGRTEVRQYVEQIFAPTFEKVYNCRAIPKKTGLCYEFGETGSPAGHGKYKVLKPVLPQEEGKEVETMRVHELLGFCEEIMQSIAELLMCMPQSVRYLLKTIELAAMKAIPESKAKKEEVRKVVIDFMFHLWWYPIMGEPAQYGLVKSCKVEFEFLNNIYTIIKVLNAVFYQRPFDSTPGIPSRVNDFIKKKSPLVNQYLDQLLSITIPQETEQAEGEETPIIATIMCMSLESIQFLYFLSMNSIEHFNATQPSFTKYLNRIKDFLINGDGAKIFEPKLSLFKPVHAKSQETKGRAHYVVLQDYCFTDKGDSMVFPENWQKVVCELLVELNLGKYSQMSSRLHDEIEEGLVLYDILAKVQEFPEIFSVLSSKSNKVNLLTEILATFMKDGQEISRKEIIEITEQYSSAIFNKEEKEASIEQYMQNVINTAQAYTRKIKSANLQLEMEIVPGLLAGKIIDMKKHFPFLIEKVEAYGSLISPQTKKPPPSIFSSCITPQKMYYSAFIVPKYRQKQNYIFKLSTTNPAAPTINMKMLFTSGSVPKKTKRNILFKGSSIAEFIDIYSKLPDITKLVTEKDNSTGLLGLYRDFMKLVAHSVDKESELAHYTADQKEKVISHIRNYIMFKLYPHIFPANPSEDDIRLYSKLQKLQWVPYSHFDVKKEYYREELCKLIVEEIRKVEEKVTPQDKLSSFIKVYQIVFDAIDVYSQKSVPAGADESSPLIVYLTLKACPRQMYSTINYIDLFRGNTESKSSGYEEYCYRTILAAVRHFEELDVEKLEAQYKDHGKEG